MAHFLIKPAKDGCKFDFISTNGHTVCTSEVYKSLDGCKNGIESVKKNAALNKVEDLTEKGEALTHPKFQIYEDKAGKFRFRLTARNGQINAVSEDFKQKSDCKKVVEMIAKEVVKATIKKEK